MSESNEARCVICRKQLTTDRYELDDYELDTLVYELNAKNAARVQHKYGSVPICPDCFAATGFAAEYDEEPEAPPLVQLFPLTRKKSDE